MTTLITWTHKDYTPRLPSSRRRCSSSASNQFSPSLQELEQPLKTDLLVLNDFAQQENKKKVSMTLSKKHGHLHHLSRARARVKSTEAPRVPVVAHHDVPDVLVLTCF